MASSIYSKVHAKVRVPEEEGKNLNVSLTITAVNRTGQALSLKYPYVLPKINGIQLLIFLIHSTMMLRSWHSRLSMKPSMLTRRRQKLRKQPTWLPGK